MAAEPPAKRSSSLNEAAAAARKQLSPKYVQLRGDQQIELDVLARELQAARTRKAERITANTVIRVAVDVLLNAAESSSAIPRRNFSPASWRTSRTWNNGPRKARKTPRGPDQNGLSG